MSILDQQQVIEKQTEEACISRSHAEGYGNYTYGSVSYVWGLDNEIIIKKI